MNVQRHTQHHREIDAAFDEGTVKEDELASYNTRSNGMNPQPADHAPESALIVFAFSVVLFALVSVTALACSNDAGENQSTSDTVRMEAVDAQQDGEASESRDGESASSGESGEHGGDGGAMESSGESGEYGGEGGENEGEGGGSEEGEESGALLALDETYDTVRKGARLILNYDAGTNSFVGTVSNTTGETLRRVRVEVHLSNGTELGPTTPVDLTSGEMTEVTLSATAEPFTGWTPHAEVDTGDGSGGEHGEGGEGGEGGGEHGGRGESGEGGGEDGEHREGGEGDGSA